MNFIACKLYLHKMDLKKFLMKNKTERKKEEKERGREEGMKGKGRKWVL